MRNPIRPKTPPPPPQPPPPPPDVSLTEPIKRKRPVSRTAKTVRSMIRSFPIITPMTCKIPSFPSPTGIITSSVGGSSHKVTGTLYGNKKGHVTLSLQDAPGRLPNLVLELPIQTHVLHKELRTGMVRIALECEKQPSSDPSSHHGSRNKLMEEGVWSMYWNGKKAGFGIKRDANETDLNVMELLKVISMGVGVVPVVEGSEVAYIRANFEHVVGSKDSETLYMLTPEGNNAPELTIFFVRL